MMTNVLSWTKSVSLLQSTGVRPATRVTSLPHCLALHSHHPVISKTNSCQLIMLLPYVPSFILFYLARNAYKNDKTEKCIIIPGILSEHWPHVETHIKCLVTLF